MSGWDAEKEIFTSLPIVYFLDWGGGQLEMLPFGVYDPSRKRYIKDEKEICFTITFSGASYPTTLFDTTGTFNIIKMHILPFINVNFKLVRIFFRCFYDNILSFCSNCTGARFYFTTSWVKWTRCKSQCLLFNR